MFALVAGAATGDAASVDVALSCRCGAMRGTLQAGPGLGLHVVCSCDDCRAYARALGRDDVLDDNGGTDIWQAPPARVRITAGREHLRCLRLSDQGLLRFHAGCCSTPIANTMASAKVPFAGVAGQARLTPFFDDDGRPVVVPRVLSRAEREAAR